MRGGWWKHYNYVRLNSAIGYITPKDMLVDRKHEIHAERRRKRALKLYESLVNKLTSLRVIQHTTRCLFA